MPAYRDSFKLDIEDIDLIENALRAHAGTASGADADPRRANSVQTLLGKIHAQKIFFSHAGRRQVPNG